MPGIVLYFKVHDLIKTLVSTVQTNMKSCCGGCCLKTFINDMFRPVTGFFRVGGVHRIWV